jgi:hypothetical protein
MPVMSAIFALLFIVYTAYRVLSQRTGATLLHILLALATILALTFYADDTNLNLLVGVGVMLGGVLLFVVESRRANPDLNHSQGILVIGVSVLLLISVLVGPAIEGAVSQFTLDGVATAQDTSGDNPPALAATSIPVQQASDEAASEPITLATNTPAAVRVTVDNPLPTRYVFSTPAPTVTVENVVLCQGVVQNNLNLRANPSADAQLLLTIPAGSNVPLYAQNADASWLYTGYDGSEGWVSAEYVIQNADCDNLPERPAS